MVQVALITGASRGLGLALARGLAQRGWRLVIDARGASELEAVAAELRGLTEVTAVAGDVGVEDHRLALYEAVASTGRLDLLVNNASILGASPPARLLDLPLDDLRAVFEVNTLAPLRLVQLTISLLERSGGVVVNITSDAGVEGYEGWGGYGSSKAALEALSRVLAAEHPEILVQWVDPGDMRTRMHQDAFPGEDISDRPAPEERLPALLALLLDRDRTSGRYELAKLAAVTT